MAAAVFLAGCANTTYGTGTPIGLQTVQDVAGMAGASPEREKIEYEARPPVVLPPDASVLPPPGQGGQAVARADWPDDPEQRQAAQGEAPPVNAYDPRFRLPRGSGVASNQPNYDPDYSPEEAARATPGEEERARLAFARAAQSGAAVDEFGTPVRQYLSDPPTRYREPDPAAPVEVSDSENCKQPPAIRLPWRERKPGECKT